MNLPSIDAVGLRQLFEIKKTYQLVDIRERFEYEICHIPETTHFVPLARLMIELPNLTPSLPTVLLCRSGVRSQLATRQLLEAGFPLAQNLTGGILAYIHTFNLDWTTY